MIVNQLSQLVLRHTHTSTTVLTLYFPFLKIQVAGKNASITKVFLLITFVVIALWIMLILQSPIR